MKNSDKKAFVGIFFDRHKRKIYHWYVNSSGKIKKDFFTTAYDFYTQREDKTCKNVKKDIFGRKVYHRITKSYEELNRATEMGSCEAKVPQEIKYLHRVYENNELVPDISVFNIGIIDIEVESEFEFPTPEKAKFPINLISIWTSKSNRIHTFGTKEYTGDKDINYTLCSTEKEMLEKFFDYYESTQINIISGWYIKQFDIPYIVRRCQELKVDNRFSPIGYCEENQNKAGGYHIDGGGYIIGGVATLDYLDLYKNFIYDKKESYQLNNICKAEINEGKSEYEGTINTAWKTDWNKFVEYNIQDVNLVKKLDDKLRFFDLAINLSYQCLVPFEKVFSAVNLITGVLMKYCHRKGIVLPDINGVKEDFIGAYVEAKEGLYHYVVNYDVQSLYPTLIRSFNISPETLVINPEEKNKSKLISTPLEGVYYKKEQGVLPEIVEDFFNKRLLFIEKNKVCIGISQNLSNEEISKRFKVSLEKIPKLILEIKSENGNATYYKRQEQIIKIFMNSMYGVLANKYFCMFNVTNAKTITSCGQDVIKYLTSNTDKWFKNNWHNKYQVFFPEYYKGILDPLNKDLVCLIDTDSGHICLEEIIDSLGIKFNNNKEFLNFVIKLDEKFFKPFFKRLLELYSKKYGCKDLINFQKEKIILKKIILAKKKYCDYVIDKKGEQFDPPKLSITGIEIIKTDTCKFGRKYLKQILQMIIETEDKKKVLNFINNIKDDFFNNTPIEDMSIPKGVKDYKKYAKKEDFNEVEKTLIFKLHTPIHCRAAICYNYLVRKYSLPYQLIGDKTKLKYIYVNEENEIRQNVIGFIDKFPEKFKEIFQIDMNTQWEKAIENIAGRFFKVLKWGNVWDEEVVWTI